MTEHPLQTLALTIPDWLPWALMVGGGIVVIAVLAWAINVKRRSGGDGWDRIKHDQPAPRSTPPSPRSTPPHSAPTDPSAELLHIVQTMTGELDRKIDRLERLIAAADERINTLHRSSEAPRSAQPTSQFTGGSAAHSGRQTASDDHVSAEVIRLAGQGFTPLQIAQKLGHGVGMVELVLALRR